MSFLSAEQVLCCIAPGERVTLLLRHAERRHITAQDADHGAHVPLTEKGGEQAFAAGKEFSVLNGPYFFGSSPVFRCRQTAAFIAEACGASEYAVPEKVAPLQPLAEFYVSDFEEYMRHLREGFYPAICKWVADFRDLLRLKKAQKPSSSSFWSIRREILTCFARMMLGLCRFFRILPTSALTQTVG